MHMGQCFVHIQVYFVYNSFCNVTQQHKMQMKMQFMQMFTFNLHTLFMSLFTFILQKDSAHKYSMVRSCCAVGCTNRQGGEKANLSFYRIPRGKTPTELLRRKEWIRVIRRDDWKTWSQEKISKAFICSEHFISGMVPSLFMM